MSDTEHEGGQNERRCPVPHASSTEGTTAGGAATETRCPYTRVKKSLGKLIWRPKSKREGIGPFKYVFLNGFYYIMETANRMFARDPNRKISWDKWPTSLGVLYLLAKIWFNRTNAITDPYDYATNDTKKFGPPPESRKHSIETDGTYVSDDENPQMGAAMTRFGSNIPPKKVRPDPENITPSPREAGKLRWRKIDPETGKEITVYAMILNDMAGGWIQFQFHGFGGNTKRDAVGVCPHMMKREPHDNWPGGVAQIDRTSVDHTRITDNGRPTPLNERVQAWIQGELYGTNEEELRPLRSFKGGKMRVEDDGRLPADPKKPGIDLTGFSNNFNPLLSFLHWLFVSEHNAIADYYASFHPDWDDEQLFQKARRVNIAQIARIHTIQWTEDLLQHPTLQIGMHADWYGLLGQRKKMWIMRMCHRYPLFERMTRWLRSSDLLFGMPGSAWVHHDGPFQVPKHFRLVYRLHEMVLSETEICEPGTDRLLDRVKLLDFIMHNTRDQVERHGYEVLGWSFVRKSCGALKPHNVARALTQFKNQQDGTLTDICERDLFREYTDGTGTYQEFRASVGEPPVKNFLELCGGDAEMARELSIKFDGDVDAVPAGIGILCEPKPEGFALGFCQFYQFVLNAPRRVKSNRHLTELFTYEYYMEGMNWVEHGGGMLGAMYRHLPRLRPLMEGVTRAFAPWKDTETFPARVLANTHTFTANVFKSDLRTVILGAITAFLAVWMGAVSLTTAALLLVAVALIPGWLTVRRMLAMRFMQLCWKKAYTDKRHFMFGTLKRAENSMASAAVFGRLHAMAVILGSLGLAWVYGFSHPIVGILLVAIAFSGMRTRKWSDAFASEIHVLKIALRNRMREGRPVTEPDSLSGVSDKAKRYAFSPRVNQEPIGHRMYNVNGGVDMKELDYMFRLYAPGRDYFSEYDFARMRQGNAWRDADEGRGNFLSRFFARRAQKRAAARLLLLFADRIVEEDKKLVPAISKDMLVRFYQGTAQADLLLEQTELDIDPAQ